MAPAKSSGATIKLIMLFCSTQVFTLQLYIHRGHLSCVWNCVFELWKQSGSESIELHASD